MTSPSPRAHHEDSDDEVPQLSAHALAALQEFYAERLQTASKDEDDPTITGDKERVDVAEDWVKNQYPKIIDYQEECLLLPAYTLIPHILVYVCTMYL